MILSETQTETFLEAAKPLIKWLNENAHPHTQVIVDTNSAELFEGISYQMTNEFIKD